ncbi:MAG: phenylalanine--tRNA ligase subunit beta [Flavobacteriales bacterium]|nr:phenylalanine--tRNA ligase subunit beta [Flavobacteriales bacterium]
MNVSLDWLRTWLPMEGQPQDAHAISDILTATGLEVEGVEEIPAVPGGLKGMVVGEVLTCEQHPNADRLRVTTVNVGEESPLNIVCGAPNVAQGQKVIVATIGATCHPTEGDPFKIKKGKIRGEVSEGMICAEDELGIGQSHDGILVLDAAAQVGQPAAAALGVESDHRIEIGLTPNRTDAMGHIGVARDLRAAMLWNGGGGTGTGIPALAPIPQPALSEGNGPIRLEVDAPEDAPCYLGVTLRNVQVAPSPDWMQQRLRAIGLEPKNNVVDVTNYILHDLGQPLHAFDADQIAGQCVRVRKAQEGERFTALDDKELTLTAADLVIADAEKPMCLAGVFGGAESGVHSGTTSVFLESAWFEPVTIRKSAKRHTLSTDASFRFERGVDPNMAAPALEKAVTLLMEYAGATVDGGVQAFRGTLPGPQVVNLSWDRLDTMIGIALDRDRVRGILGALDIGIQSEKDGMLALEVPAYRRDVTRPADVVEEVLRIHGYDHIPLPGRMTVSLSAKPNPDPEQLRNDLASTLVGRGFHEVMHNSLVPSAHLKLVEDPSLQPERAVLLLNPLSSELDAMRQTLLLQGLETVARNRNHQRPDLSLFEFGKVYAQSETGGHKETERLALTVSGRTSPENWRKQEQDGMSFLKGAVEALLTQSGVAGIHCAALPSGGFFKEGLEWKGAKGFSVRAGLVHPALCRQFGIEADVFHADLPFDALVTWSGKRKVKAQDLPRFPGVRRDLSLKVSAGTSYAEIESVARQTGGKLLRHVNLFDVYHDEKTGLDSYAISLHLQDEDKTLSDKAIDKTVHRVREQLEQRLGVTLR